MQITIEMHCKLFFLTGVFLTGVYNQEENTRNV